MVELRWCFPKPVVASESARVIVFRVITIEKSSGIVSTGDEQAIGPAPDGCIRWIDLLHQDAASLTTLAEQFAFHPLTIEDCLHFDQRPKLETYDDYLFLVIQGFHVDWDRIHEAVALELHVFIGNNFVVTVHEHATPALDGVWNRVAQDGRLVANGTDQLSYLIADAMIDSYFPIIDELHLRLDQLEDRVLVPSQNLSLSEIMAFKRLLIELRKILSPQRDVLALLSKRGDTLISNQVAVYFRDVYDHTLRVHESVESARELIGNVRDAHLWNASQRTNEIMKRLTILSAIFLPLTFITGFFGQNFESLPFSSRELMYFMLFCCVAIPVGMLLYFARSKWFDAHVE